MNNFKEEVNELKSLLSVSTDAQLAELVGVEVPTISTWKQRGLSKSAKLVLANLKHKSIQNELPINNNEYTIIKLYPNIKASCANGSVCVVEDYDIQEMKFPTSYLLNHLGIKCAKDVHAIVADGNSMEPLIKDGDILFITPFDTVRDGNIYIVNVNGEIYCKKVYKNPITKGLILKGENEIAPKYEISENDMETVKFMGEVFVVMNVNVLRRLR